MAMDHEELRLTYEVRALEIDNAVLNMNKEIEKQRKLIEEWRASCGTKAKTPTRKFFLPTQ